MKRTLSTTILLTAALAAIATSPATDPNETFEVRAEVDPFPLTLSAGETVSLRYELYVNAAGLDALGDPANSAFYLGFEDAIDEGEPTLAATIAVDGGPSGTMGPVDLAATDGALGLRVDGVLADCPPTELPAEEGLLDAEQSWCKVTIGASIIGGGTGAVSLIVSPSASAPFVYGEIPEGTYPEVVLIEVATAE